VGPEAAASGFAWVAVGKKLRSGVRQKRGLGRVTVRWGWGQWRTQDDKLGGAKKTGHDNLLIFLDRGLGSTDGDLL
jgi:hypothetical protein